jgi:hypothetical protein
MWGRYENLYSFTDNLKVFDNKSYYFAVPVL